MHLSSLALARRRAALATQAKLWNMRLFHSSQRRCEQYRDVGQEVRARVISRTRMMLTVSVPDLQASRPQRGCKR